MRDIWLALLSNYAKDFVSLKHRITRLGDFFLSVYFSFNGDNFF